MIPSIGLGRQRRRCDPALSSPSVDAEQSRKRTDDRRAPRQWTSDKLHQTRCRGSAVSPLNTHFSTVGAFSRLCIPPPRKNLNELSFTPRAGPGLQPSHLATAVKHGTVGLTQDTCAAKNDAFYNLAGLAILKLCLYYNTTRNGMQVRIGAPAT